MFLERPCIVWWNRFVIHFAFTIQWEEREEGGELVSVKQLSEKTGVPEATLYKYVYDCGTLFVQMITITSMQHRWKSDKQNIYIKAGQEMRQRLTDGVFNMLRIHLDRLPLSAVCVIEKYRILLF